MGTQLPLPQRGTAPNFRPISVRPSGCMDQDATWYGGRPWPRRLCVRWGPSPSPKGGRSPPIFFDPCLLWPSGWMDQDGTWHGGIGLSPGSCLWSTVYNNDALHSFSGAIQEPRRIYLLIYRLSWRVLKTWTSVTLSRGCASPATVSTPWARTAVSVNPASAETRRPAPAKVTLSRIYLFIYQ